MISHYSIQNLIGSGFSCQVFSAQSSKDLQHYAIKVFQHSKMTKEQLSLVKNEIEILQLLKNPNVIQFHEFIYTQTVTYLVTELCKYGSLEEQLKKKSLFKEIQAINFLIQMCGALFELKKNKIIHNDIKPSNILLCQNCFKLADFGFAMKEGNVVQFNFGSPLYMSPETLSTSQHSYQTDIWSLGVTVYQLCYGFTPFNAQSEKELLNCYYTMPIQFKPNISQRLQNIISQMLEIDQSKRITVEQLFKLLTEKENQQSIGQKSKGNDRSQRLSIEKMSAIIENCDIPPLQLSKQVAPLQIQVVQPQRRPSKDLESSKRNSFQPIEQEIVQQRRLKSFHTSDKQAFRFREQACNICQFVKNLRSEIHDNELLTYALTGILLYYTKQDQQLENNQITVFVEQQKQPNIFQMVKADLLQFCLSQLSFTIKFQINSLEGITQVRFFVSQKFYPESANSIRLLINLYNLYRVLKSGDISIPLVPVNENISYLEAMQLLRQIYI